MAFADRPAESRIVFGRVLTYYVVGVGTLTLGVFAVARPLVLILTKPAYHDAWTVVGLSATAQFLAGVYAVLLPRMYIAKDVQYTGLLQAIAAAVGIACNIVLIPRFGIGGAAISLVTSYAALALVQLGWNSWRGYQPVFYEVRRLLQFGFVFSAFAAITLVRRGWTIPQEVALSAGLVLSLPALVYWLLTSAERSAIWMFVANSMNRTVVLEAPDAPAALSNGRNVGGL